MSEAQKITNRCKGCHARSRDWLREHLPLYPENELALYRELFMIAASSLHFVVRAEEELKKEDLTSQRGQGLVAVQTKFLREFRFACAALKIGEHVRNGNLPGRRVHRAKKDGGGYLFDPRKYFDD